MAQKHFLAAHFVLLILCCLFCAAHFVLHILCFKTFALNVSNKPVYKPQWCIYLKGSLNFWRHHWIGLYYLYYAGYFLNPNTTAEIEVEKILPGSQYRYVPVPVPESSFQVNARKLQEICWIANKNSLGSTIKLLRFFSPFRRKRLFPNFTVAGTF